MTRAKPARIDRSLYDIISNIKENKIRETGIDITFSQASRFLVKEYLEGKCGRPLNGKERKLMDI